MAVTFQLPDDVEQRLRARRINLESEAKESFLIDLYRREELSHLALSKALGLDRYDTEQVLRKHNVTEDLGTAEDVLAELRAVEELRAAGR
jgi:predicted HTH domain antitoxin